MELANLENFKSIQYNNHLKSISFKSFSKYKFIDPNTTTEFVNLSNLFNNVAELRGSTTRSNIYKRGLPFKIEGRQL